MEKNFNKLVRDKIPEIIEANKEQVEFKILSDEEYLIELKKKLLEECNEVINVNNKDELLEELADLLEVMKALAKIGDFNFRDIEKVAKQKALKRGAFDNKIYLIKTITKD